VTNNAGFTVSGASTPQTVSAGGTTPIDYTLTATNSGVSTSAAPVTITDEIPASLGYVPGSAACGATPQGVTCQAAETGSTVTWTISAGVPAGASVPLTFAAYALGSDAAGVVTDQATWTGPGCNSTCTTNTITNDISTLVVTKSVTPGGTVVAGETLMYTLTGQYASPAGSSSTGTLQIFDAAPANTTLVAGSESCGTLSSTTTPSCMVSVDSQGNITWTVGPGIPAGGTVAVTFQVVTSSTLPSGTKITNQANYSYSGDDPSTNPVTTPVTNDATFQVSKAVSASVVTAGTSTPLTYTFDVQNEGISSSTDPLVISDTVPTGTVLVPGSASCGSLATSVTPSCKVSVSGDVVTWTVSSGVTGGQSFTLTFEVTVPATTKGTVTNTGQWTGDGCTPSGGASTCGTNSVTTTVLAPAAFSVIKEATAAVVQAGQSQPVGYLLLATNVGSSPSTTALVLTDTVPVGTTLVANSANCGLLGATTTPTCAVAISGNEITWTISPGVAPGSAVAVAFEVTIDSTATGSITNTAQWSGPGCTPTGSATTCPTNTTTISVQAPAVFTVVKQVSASVATAGQSAPLTYQLVVTNTGASTSVDPVVITDTVPTGTALVAGSVSCGSLSATSTPACDVSVSGDQIEWTIEPGVAPGSGTTLSFGVTVDSTATGSITNTAQWSGPGCTPTGSATTCPTNKTTTTLTAPADVTVTKLVSTSTTVAGSSTPLQYTLIVQNGGASPTEVPVTVTDAVPTGTSLVATSPSCGGLGASTTPTCTVSASGGAVTWNIGAGLAAGQSIDLQFAVTVPAATTGGTIISNTAEWTGPGCVPSGQASSCPTDTVTTLVQNLAHFTVEKSATPATVVAGSSTPVAYTLAVDNSGTSTSTSSVTVTDAAPAGTSLVAGSATCGTVPSGVTCQASVSGSSITWTISAGVPAGTTIDLGFAVTVDGTTPPGTISNTAQWSGPGCASSTCPTNTTTTTVTSGASFTVDASGSPQTISAGGTTPVTYTLAVDNSGTSTSTAPVTVTATVPTGLTLVPGTATCGTVPSGVTCQASLSGSSITWTISAGVPAGTTIDVTYQASADASDQAGTVTETFGWNGPGCTHACTSNTVTTDISTMVVTKAVNPPGTVTAGEKLTYTLTAAYTSPAGTASSGVLTITDSAPSGTTLDAGTPSCGTLSSTTTPTCTVSVDSTTGLITWTIGPGVPAGGSVAVTFSVTTSPQTVSGSIITNTANYDYAGDDPATNTVQTVVSAPTTTSTSSTAVGAQGTSSTGANGAVLVADVLRADTSTNQVTTPVTNSASNGSGASGVVSGKLSVAPTSAVAVGSTLSYTVVLNSTGGVVSSPITVTDVAPDGETVAPASVTCGALPSGATCTGSVSGQTVQWVVTPPTAGLPSGSTIDLQFSASVDSSAAGGALYDGAELSGPCNPCSTNFVVSKVLNSTTTSSKSNYDVTVTKSVNTAGPVPAGSSADIVYTLTIANGASAPATALPVTVTDSVPAGTALVAGSPSCGALSATTTPTCTVSVSGSTLTWTVGPGLVAGQQDALTFAVSVLPTTAPGTIKNTGSYTSPNCNGTCSTNTVSTTTGSGAIVQVQKSASAASVNSGSTITYTLAVSNTGTGPTQNDTLVLDTVPSGATLVGTPACPATLPSGVTCTASEQSYGGITAVSWQLGPGIAAGSAPIDLTFEVQATGSTTTIVNTAQFSGDGCAAGPMCSTNQVTVNVNQLPPTPVVFASFTVTKSASVSSINAGSPTPITYTLSAVNTASVASTEPLVLTDTVPAGTTYVAGSAACPTGSSSTSTPSCTVTVSGSTITWTIGPGVPAGATEAVSFSVTLATGATTSIVNTAAWSGQGCSTAGGCSTNTVTVPIVVTQAAGSAAWDFTKTASSVTVTAGSGAHLTYTITGTNIGSAATTTDAVVTDTVPSGTTYVPGSAACSAPSGVGCTVSYDSSTQTMTWTIGPGVSQGKSVVLSFATVLAATATPGTTITNTARWSGQGCGSAGGCPTNTANTTVRPAASTPALKSGGGSAVVPGATLVHTGEPWAGAGRWAGLLAAAGGLLLVGGVVRRRRARIS